MSTAGPPAGASGPVRAARWLLVAYGVVLAVVLLWPAASLSDGGVDVLTRAAFALGLDLGASTSTVVEVLANVAITVPLAVLARVVWPGPRGWQWTIGGLVVGLSAEVAQALFLPERYPSPVDVVANTLGVGLGALLASPYARRRRRRRDEVRERG